MQTHVHHSLPESINIVQKPILINYEHITTPELLTKCAKDEVSGAGFHHDYMRAIEESGLIEIADKVMLPHGCYRYKWGSQGAKLKPSTFFPAEWTRAQTIEKICESMKNTQEIVYLNGQRYLHLGLTSEGIPISAIIEHGKYNAKLISAYPNFKL